MQMTPKAGHAVAALVDLARYGGTRHVSLHSIAARRQISLSYLEHLFARLRRNGLVRALRGPGGGYVLARPAGEINLAEIVHAVDGHGENAHRPGARADRRASSEAAIAGALWQRVAEHLEQAMQDMDLQSLVDHDPSPVALQHHSSASLQHRSPVLTMPAPTRQPRARLISSVFDLADHQV